MKKLLLLCLVLLGGFGTVFADNIYIVGDAPFGGWNTNDGVLMTDNGDGTFTYVYTPASNTTVYFCLASALTSEAGDWENFNKNSYRPESGAKYVQFEPLTLSSTNGSNSVGMDFKAGVTYTFKFTKATKKFVVLSSVVPGLYLRSNIDATADNGWKTWDADFSDLTDYKFTSYGWDSSSEKLRYSYNVTSESLAKMISIGQSDLYFRIQNDDNEMPQIRPNNADYTFDFSDGKYATGQDGWSNNSGTTGTLSKFIVSHSSIKAAEYKITVYVGCYNWGRLYNTSMEIVSMPVTISSVGKATYSCDRALNFYGISNINAYMITGVNSTGSLIQSDAMNEVPANTGLYLEGAEGTYNIPVITTNDASEVSTSDNKLVPGNDATVNQTVIIDEKSYTNFILTKKTTESTDDPLKFYKVNSTYGNDVPKGKAYLQILSSLLSGSRDFLWFDNDATGINAIDNGPLTIDANAPMYNLAGQRVGKNYKGVVIVNGKKVVLK